MPYEVRDNSGSLFVNDRKENDKQPDRTGTAMIGGKEYFVSGWLKKGKSGTPFLSLGFRPKPQSPAKQPETVAAEAEEWDTPF